MTPSKQDKEIDLSRYCKDDGRTLEVMALVPVVKKRGRPSLSINKSINKKSNKNNKSNNKSNKKINKKSSMIQARHVYVKEKRKRSASEEEEGVEEREAREKPRAKKE